MPARPPPEGPRWLRVAALLLAVHRCAGLRLSLASNHSGAVARQPVLADPCDCDKCEGKARVYTTSVSSWLCGPSMPVRDKMCADSQTHDGKVRAKPFKQFCVCNCQPFIAGLEKQCVAMSARELAVTKDDKGNCEDPMLMTEVETRAFPGGEEAAIAAALAAKSGKPLPGVPVKKVRPDETENLGLTKAAADDAEAELKHVEVARENVENAKWLADHE